MSGLSFDELLQRARSGQVGAVDVLLARHQRQLRGYAKRLGTSQPNGARPSDFVQDVAVRALDRFETFHGTTEAEWIAWLRRILQSQVLMAARRAGRAKRGSGVAIALNTPEAQNAQDSGPTPSCAASLVEDWHRVLSCLHELPEAQKEAIVLCYLKELPVVEVAQAMLRSEAAVASLLQRGLCALRGLVAGPISTDAESTQAAAKQQSKALLIYLRRRDLGERIDQETFISEYPQCASDLRATLYWIEKIQAVRPRSA